MTLIRARCHVIGWRIKARISYPWLWLFQRTSPSELHLRLSCTPTPGRLANIPQAPKTFSPATAKHSSEQTLGRCPWQGLRELLGPSHFGEAIIQLCPLPGTLHMPFAFPTELTCLKKSFLRPVVCMSAASLSSSWCCPWPSKFVFHLRSIESLSVQFDKFSLPFLVFFFKASNNLCFTENKCWKRPQAQKPSLLVLTSVSVAAMKVPRAAAWLAVLWGGAEGRVDQPRLICH